MDLFTCSVTRIKNTFNGEISTIVRHTVVHCIQYDWITDGWKDIQQHPDSQKKPTANAYIVIHSLCLHEEKSKAIKNHLFPTKNMSSESISQLRELFEKELTANSSLYHPIDIERVRTDDWQIKRYLLDQPDGDETKAFAALIKCLQWKCSFGIHDRTDQYFPKELWELSGTELKGRDKQGRVINWGTAKQAPITAKEMALLNQQYLAHVMERTDKESGKDGCIFVAAVKVAGLLTIDKELEQFKNEMIDHYYPQLVKSVYIVDLPWLLNAIIKIIMAFMSAKTRQLVHMISSAQLAEEVDIEFIPVELKGKREKTIYPENLQPLDQIYHKFGLEKSFVDQLYQTYKFERTCINNNK